MVHTMALAAVLAVLGSGEVVLVGAKEGVVHRRVPLPEEGVAIFAAPDGAALVPFSHGDATAVVRPDGHIRVQPGRLFPLFFDEFDRMFVFSPGQLVLLAYPQRVRISEVALPGIEGVRHAAVTSNGVVVAMVGMAVGTPGVWLVTTVGEPRVMAVPIPCAAERVGLAPNGAWLAVACAEGELVMTTTGGAGVQRLVLGGAITAMAVEESAGELLVGTAAADGKGSLLRLRVHPGTPRLVRERWRTQLPRPPRALVASGPMVMVLDERGVGVWERGGRRLASEVPLAGGRDLALLRLSPAGIPEDWGEPETSP